MPSEDERRQIEADAATRVRAQWGRVEPRTLGDVVAEIRARMEEGTWGHQTFAEGIDTLARLTQAVHVLAKDELAAEESEQNRNELGAD